MIRSPARLARDIIKRVTGRPAGKVLQDLARLQIASADVLLDKGPIVVLAPHPDDESLGCGGLLALAARKGVGARIIFMTDGSGSHPGSTEFPPEKLRDLREREAIEAARALGLPADALVFLRQPDGALPRKGPEADALVSRIAAECERMASASLLSTWIFDGHPDHVTTAILAKRVSRRIRTDLYYYPIWGLRLDPAVRLRVPARPRGWRIDVSQGLDEKRKAIASHRSQMTNMIRDSEISAPADEIFAAFSQPYETYLAA